MSGAEPAGETEAPPTPEVFSKSEVSSKPEVSPTPEAAGTADAAVEARARALELAGAFANEGYKTRDGFFGGRLETGATGVLEVNLYAGNHYWFCAAAESGRTLDVRVFDASGQPVDTLWYQKDSLAGAGWTPDVSGPYLVAVKLVDGEPSEFCMVYCYK